MSNIGLYVSKEASCIGSLIGTKNIDRTARYKIGIRQLSYMLKPQIIPPNFKEKKKEKKTKMKNHEDWAEKIFCRFRP